MGGAIPIISLLKIPANRHLICSNYHENTIPVTAFLSAQIAPESLSAGASPQTPLGELTALPQTP